MESNVTTQRFTQSVMHNASCDETVPRNLPMPVQCTCSWREY